jgi:molybdopterin molybdotransferase
VTQPPAERIDVAEATALIAAHLPARPTVRVPLAAAAGEFLREPIRAERDQPPFDRVTMDGFAIRHPAFAGGRRRFRVVARQAAGDAAATVGADDAAVWIMTGAALPPDADAIIPVERTRREGSEVVVEDSYPASAGQFVHRTGSDHAAGAMLLAPGTRIGPPEMAVLTIGGAADVAIAARPAIAVISTGDELVDVGEPVSTFHIRSSNDRAVVTALAAAGFATRSRVRLPDDPAVLTREIGALLASHDTLVLSGGVSLGAFDHIPRTLADLGVQVVFHKVRQRPGMPFWFGVSPDGKPVFALPGNPVSTLVCLVRYVIPALLGALGATPRERWVPLASPVEFAPDLAYFLPVRLRWAADGRVAAEPQPTNTSGDFVALAGTDGFVELPRGGRQFPAGYAARFFGWSLPAC